MSSGEPADLGSLQHASKIDVYNPAGLPQRLPGSRAAHTPCAAGFASQFLFESLDVEPDPILRLERVASWTRQRSRDFEQCALIRTPAESKKTGSSGSQRPPMWLSRTPKAAIEDSLSAEWALLAWRVRSIGWKRSLTISAPVIIHMDAVPATRARKSFERSAPGIVGQRRPAFPIPAR